MHFICFNNQFYPADEPLLTIQNRSYKYGDGLFETMKVYKGRLLHKELHFERLLSSLNLLQIRLPENSETLTEKILELCRLNSVSELGRVRLSVYREGYEAGGYAIEALPLDEEVNEWNQNGLTIDLYPNVRKSTDAFSNLKTANFLPYVLADLYAREKGLGDALVLNTDNHLCDTSRANIFLIKDTRIYTPALYQGCVNGVMRRYLIERLKELGHPVIQRELTETDLYEADEVFLTNAISGIRWVAAFRDKPYRFDQAYFIYQQTLSTIYL